MDLEERLRRLAQGVRVTDLLNAPVANAHEASGVRSLADIGEGESHGIIELMFLMAAVDGEISDPEARQLLASVEALTDLGMLERVDIGDTLADLNERLSDDGWSARLTVAASKVRSEEARSFAFRLAAGVAFVDDFVANAEAAAIDSLAAALEIDGEESQGLLREVHALLFGD